MIPYKDEFRGVAVTPTLFDTTTPDFSDRKDFDPKSGKFARSFTSGRAWARIPSVQAVTHCNKDTRMFFKVAPNGNTYDGRTIKAYNTSTEFVFPMGSYIGRREIRLFFSVYRVINVESAREYLHGLVYHDIRVAYESIGNKSLRFVREGYYAYLPVDTHERDKKQGLIQYGGGKDNSVKPFFDINVDVKL